MPGAELLQIWIALCCARGALHCDPMEPVNLMAYSVGKSLA